MTLQIFILGTLSEAESHPYDIKKRLLKSLGNTIPINDGTLYYQFDVLQKKGLIQKLEVVQSDNRPEKTTYGITDKGLKALETEIYAAYQNVTSISALYATLFYLDKIDKNKLAYLIEEAIDKRQDKLKLIEDTDLDTLQIPQEKQQPLELLTDHAYHSIQSDVAWLKKLLVYVRSE
ncbi:DNA-binding transcriptional regulator, PadR family [Paenibacillus algorifonticola]|uniref:DNA-binding transcriptional regulator, PadR family n=1 Tax=Paenibacillus algorifonticola TaxID=684063 RepID=A0A1I2ABU9_9BACL|nr:PadR family transcriptional regulator [Paenibacillus algorifonticola]SFE41366.1 DNA-binding transcriptional regulator, PadR family [Paenibacillus algorifonticola]